MTIASLPAPITPPQVLGNLLSVDKATALSIEAGAVNQPRPLGLAIVASNDQPTIGMMVNGRTARPFANPFAF